ncbi:aminopeptidase P family protein [Nocardioides sp.]|uniref:aminopeptidase P family protein n=1 Tax=Nocardioides sp. TaxID=35761 RepID=UPI0035687FCF
MENETSEDFKVEGHDPGVPEAYSQFMRRGWGTSELDAQPHPIAGPAASRRAALAEQFPGERLVLPAGTFKVRANDTEYRFRPDTAHTYYCGNQASDAVLVIEDGHSVLYARPSSGRDSDEFFRDRMYGELWVGRRPSLEEMAHSLGLEVRHIDDLGSALESGGKTRVHRGVAPQVEALIGSDESRDRELAEVVSTARLIKDEWELAELQEACDTTTLGFEDVVRDWANAIRYGERWAEGTFFRRARAMGNDIGYDSIVGGGAHATTLHWIENTGSIDPGALVLMDMGAEGHNLYTADVTRTIPVDGTYTSRQRDVYDLVYAAQQAGIEAVRPGVPFLAAHDAAMSVLAHGLGDMGLLPCSAEESLDPSSRLYARWTLHGTSHMLGMDVHDCANTSIEVYPRGDLAEGMVLTVEPGLYFQADDLLVPEELRGLGVRIEDDIVVTADGYRNLSAALPRTANDVEAWMGRLLP